ncbi:MAG: His-Xaa-Ser system radical SAM maturase HxsC [Desulfobaccales bacterium]
MSNFTRESTFIDRPIMGVITTRLPVWQRGRPLIFLAKSTNDLRKLSYRPWMQSQLTACILADHLSLGSTNRLHYVLRLPQDRLENLNNGDVVLLDSRGFSILYKTGSPHNSILATNRCNCRCVMCPQPPANDPENLLENNLRLISLLDSKNTEHLGITGGEPTLLGADLIRLIQACRDKLPKTLLTLLTNGRKLKDLEFARDLVRAGFPGLMVEIPLFADNDTENDAIMGAKGSFYDTIEGLYNLARLGQPVGLRMVLHALTIGRLTQYAEFIYRNLPFVVQVAFMGMETIGFAKDNLDRLWIDPYEYREQLSSAVKHLARRMVPVSIYNHQLCILPPDLWPYARKSITTWKQAYPSICAPCHLKESCGGVFGTGERFSAYLHPIT